MGNVAKENRAGLFGKKPRPPGTCPDVLWDSASTQERGCRQDEERGLLCTPRPLSASVSATLVKWGDPLPTLDVLEGRSAMHMQSPTLPAGESPREVL